MTSARIVKVATLSGFFLLMTGFVAYRSGAFEKLANSSPPHSLKGPVFRPAGLVSENNDQGLAVDSPPVINTNSPEFKIMSSSKSAVIFEPPIDSNNKNKQDTGKVKKTKKDTLKKKTYMGSSKSGYIYTPEPEPDTVKKNPK